MTALGEHTYGKQKVRLTQVLRRGARHELIEISVDILFEGDFAASFERADNSGVLPTDTIKNTVYALANRCPIANIESFARDLAFHFLQRLTPLQQVKITISQDNWVRIEEHGTAFVRGGAETRMAVLEGMRAGEELISGFDNLEILKTSDSAFDHFLHDEFTTLPETRDRLLGTDLSARWEQKGTTDFDAVYADVRRILLWSFAEHKSESVQHTLHDMARAVMDEVTAIEWIRLTMPNKHRLLFDLARFGLENRNQIFVPTDEPSGFIQAALVRRV